MLRRKWIVPGCALLLVLIVVAILAGIPAALALRVAGFRSEGKTAQLFQQDDAGQATIAWPATSVIPLPTATPAANGDSAPQAAPLTALDAVQVDASFLTQPQTFLANETHADRLERGWTEDEEPAYYIEYDEQGANTYLDYWFSQFLADQTRIKNPWLDLKPGGAVLYADVDLEVGLQRVGAVLMLDSSGRQFALAGVDIGGLLFSTPPAGQIAELAGQLVSEANRALRDLVFIDPAGQLFIQQITLEEERVVILAY